MPETNALDFAKLLGVEAVSDETSGPVNFRDDALEAKLGAKVGAEGLVHCDLAGAIASISNSRAEERRNRWALMRTVWR